MRAVKRAFALVAGLGMLITTFGAVAASRADAATQTLPAMGVQVHGLDSSYTTGTRSTVLDELAAAHVGWVRVDMYWMNFEPTAPGSIQQWYVNTADEVVNQARARGLKVLVTLLGTPGWANGNAGVWTAPTDPRQFARFSGWIANHFSGRVAAWEIWNEPNRDEFLVGANATQYAGMLKAAYPAIKSADPSSLVVSGGIAYQETPWLASLYAAGAKGSFDVMATHGYQGQADLAPEVPAAGRTWLLDDVSAVHTLMVANGDGAKPIWFTEFGWSVHQNTGSELSWDRGVTDAQQAEYLVRTLSFLAANHPYVTNVFWYNERNKSTGDVQEDNYGLLRHDSTEKLVYTTLKSFLGSGGTTPNAPSSTPTPSLSVSPAPSTPEPAYTLIARTGRRDAFSKAGASGPSAPLPVTAGHSVVAAVAAASGTWAVTDDGGVFATDGAPSLGSLAGARLNKPIVGAAATPSRNGYWLVASDGGIFSFGDARFFGSTGALSLNRPITGLKPTSTDSGYWMVASDGGIFAFGDAPFLGSGAATGDTFAGMVAR